MLQETNLPLIFILSSPISPLSKSASGNLETGRYKELYDTVFYLFAPEKSNSQVITIEKPSLVRVATKLKVSRKYLNFQFSMPHQILYFAVTRFFIGEFIEDPRPRTNFFFSCMFSWCTIFSFVISRF